MDTNTKVSPTSSGKSKRAAKLFTVTRAAVIVLTIGTVGSVIQGCGGSQRPFGGRTAPERHLKGANLILASQAPIVSASLVKMIGAVTPAKVAQKGLVTLLGQFSEGDKFSLQDSTGVILEGQATGTVTAVADSNLKQVSFTLPPGLSAGVAKVLINSSSVGGNVTTTILGPAPVVDTVSLVSFSTTGGETFTVTGANLSQGLTLTIGGQPANSVVVDGNGRVLTAVSPPHIAATHKLIVVNPDTQPSLGKDVTYVGASVASPTIRAISPNSGTTAGGQTVVIAGTNFTTNPFPTVTFGGTIASVQTGSTSTSLTVVTPTGTAGAQTVVVNTGVGTAATSTYTYTASANPDVQVTLTMGAASGGSMQVTMSIAPLNGSGVNVLTGTGTPGPGALPGGGSFAAGSPTPNATFSVSSSATQINLSGLKAGTTGGGQLTFSDALMQGISPGASVTVQLTRN